MSITSISTPGAAVLAERPRGRYSKGFVESGYSGHSVDLFVLDAEGDRVLSKVDRWEPITDGDELPDGITNILFGRHLPIYDIDCAVFLDGNTLVIPESLLADRGAIQRYSRRLRRAGGSLIAGVRQTTRDGAPTIEIDFDFTTAIALVGSSTPGHFHLYVNRRMSLRRSLRIAEALFGIVDARHIRLARTQRLWEIGLTKTGAR